MYLPDISWGGGSHRLWKRHSCWMRWSRRCGPAVRPAESINGLYKAEVIHRKSWKNRAEVELATLTWVDWYNNRRLLGRLGHTPPAEAEKAYYASIGNNDLAA